jgi:membrane protein implicated in regulation of membrane protease activity
MQSGRTGRVVQLRVGGCLPMLVALAVVAVVVATAVALGAFVFAGVLVLAAVLFVARAVRRLLGRKPPPDDGQPWREVERTTLPPADGRRSPPAP